MMLVSQSSLIVPLVVSHLYQERREELGVDMVEVITFIVTLFPFLFSVQLSFFFIHERFAIAQNTDEYLAVFS